MKIIELLGYSIPPSYIILHTKSREEFFKLCNDDGTLYKLGNTLLFLDIVMGIAYIWGKDGKRKNKN